MKNHTKLSTWIEACSEKLAGHELHDFTLETLCCFDMPHPRSDAERELEPLAAEGYQAFEASYESAFEKLATGDWRGNVDSDVAKLFVRRLRAVDELLDTLADRDIGSILALGLRVRMTQIMKKGVWPAVRLRALADFYYSRAVLLLHGISNLSTDLLRSTAAKTQWQPVHEDGEIRNGIWESHYHSDAVWGPQHIRALKIDLGRFRIETLDLRGDHNEYQGLTARLQKLGAIAGCSGGFFLYSEPDIMPPSERFDPVGMILSNAELSHPPIERRASLLFADERVELRRIGLGDVTLRWNDYKLNASEAIGRSRSDTGPDSLSVAVVGRTVQAVGNSLPVPLNGFVLPWQESYGRIPDVGAELSWTGPAMEDGSPAHEGLSGGPLLLDKGEPCIDHKAEGFWGSAPPLTFSQDETGDRNLLARLAIGIDATGFLYVVAVDGRQADHALGLSLAGCAAWMQGLGCTRAANMDGGSSKRLMLLGEVMDAPTTEVATAATGDHKNKTRPVYSGLAFIPR